ncbi:MAG: LppP/LprE family lipoprotein [Nakamurella multipartita]|nr:LppP/LprE family lipoprotein [Mycobacterium sp.]
MWMSPMWTPGARAAVAATLLVVLTACGSGDSTVSKTPDPVTVTTTSTTPPPPPPTSTTPPPPDPCAVNLAAPTIARAISELPKDPRSGQPWNTEPIAGNYNECAPLSAVIVKANTNAPDPNTRAVLFHQGKFIPTGVPDTFGFNGIDAAQSTGDTVALKYTNTLGLDSVVKFRWNGNGVELIGNAG